MLKDKGSTNGVYRNKKRIKLLPLRHGDVLTLGPQELADAVTVRYIESAALVYECRALWALWCFWIHRAAVSFGFVALEWPKITINPLPESVQGPVLMTAEEDGARVPLNELPNIAHIEKERLREYSPYLPQAAVASEDSRFYWHIGVDPLGIVRALVTNIAGGEIREGASTLTQQMARNTYRDYVGTEDSAVRKIREAVVALKLETFYSKDQLMLLYFEPGVFG